MNDFLESNFDWVSSIFDLFRPWQKGDCATNRKVWIRAKSIPLHAWSNGFFHTLVSRFGSLISIAPITENKNRMDYAFLQVITTLQKPILWDFSVLIDGTMHEIHVDEIPHPPIHSPLPPSNTHIVDFISFNPYSPCKINGNNTPKPPENLDTVPSTPTTKPSQPQNSDPFNLLGIIENTNLPKKSHACMHCVSSQSGSPSSPRKQTLSCSVSSSNSAIGSALAVNVPHFLNSSSSVSSSSIFSSSPKTSLSSSYGSSSMCPDISFNNSAPAPISLNYPSPLSLEPTLFQIFPTFCQPFIPSPITLLPSSHLKPNHQT
ncbi:hypothetical protein Tsubulata_051376 [Turnera subulata]|uniref:DUF4283 domain-containing protein n=1 Tax=Turnera subulata TaxID=218843 RepID=A0A9Q0FCK4_9ROSI|nr:hypothetical protein Tsubulata_051376 [Turnera subulata]